MVSYELVQVISVQEHIFSLFEVAEQSFEGNGTLLDSLFSLSACCFMNSFFLILLPKAPLDS